MATFFNTAHNITKKSSITAFADSATEPGVKTTVTSTSHGLLNGEEVRIIGTINYDDVSGYTVSNVTTNTFDIDTVFVIDEAPSSWRAYYWHDVDLSSYLPSDASIALIKITTGGSILVGVRKKGSVDNYRAGTNTAQIFTVAGVDQNQFIQAYQSSVAPEFYLIGYLVDDEAVAFTDQLSYEKSPSVYNSWETITCPEVPDGTLFAIFGLLNTIGGSTADDVAFRYRGSVDDRSDSGKNTSKYGGHFFVPLDGNKQLECYRNYDSSPQKIYLSGYITKGQKRITGKDVSLGVTGSYQDINVSDDAPQGAGGAIVEVLTSFDAFALRKNGSDENIYLGVFGGSPWQAVGLDAGRTFEGKISNTVVDFYVWGYLQGYGFDVTLPQLIMSSGWWGTFELPQLELSGYSITQVNVGSFALPNLEMVAKGPEIGDADLTLPQLTMNAGGIVGQIANGALTLPSLTLDANSITGIAGNADFTLLRLRSAGIGITGETGNYDGTLQGLELTGYFGSHAALILPQLTMNAVGKTGQAANADLTLLNLTLTGQGFQNHIATLDVTLPQLILNAELLVGHTGNADLTLIELIMSAKGYSGVTGNAAIVLPILSMQGIGYGEYTGNASFILPQLSLSAFSEALLSEQYKTLVMNTKNMALTEYDSYDYNSLCKFGDIYLGANANGIFVLSGNDDNGANIDATIKTGFSDFGVANLKRIIDAYVGLVAGAGFTLTLITDDGVERDYSVTDSDTLIHTRKVAKLARGVKGRYHAAKLINNTGSEMELESIELNAEVLSRKR